MNDVQAISSRAGEAKDEAERAIDSTYLKPTASTEELIQNMQNYVDDLIEGKELSKESKSCLGKCCSIRWAFCKAYGANGKCR